MLMFILGNVIQFIGILIPFVGCICLFRKMQSRASMYLLLANLGCLIINGSYMLLLQTETYEGALIALKMEYFGNVVFYLTFAMFLYSYLKLNKYKWIKAVFALWATIDVLFYFLLWIGDGTPFVFESLSFELNWQFDKRIGLVMVQLEPGTLYMIRYGIICTLLLVGMIYTTVRMFSMQIESEKDNLARLAGAQFVIEISLVLMLLSDFSFDVVPICASAAILAIIISIFRDGFFGITELGQQWVFEQMEDAFVIVDEMYGYLDSNAYAKKVFNELNYKGMNETVSGDMYRLFTSEEKIQQIHGKYYHKKIMEIREKGEISGYSMFLADVTEQHELMERVREEKERADAANQAKTAFVSNVSHEIRTPMNAIVGMTQILLRQEDLSKQNREYLMNIRNSGNALLTIINDLLDMSKIESGKMELVDEEYDFMSMLRDLGMIILNRIGNKPVELLFDIDKDIPAALYGDALRIRQIIINLMNNATKFTEKGYVCLTVKVNEVCQDDMELFVSVKDTGQGIREEDIGRLFGTFQQVDAKKNHHKEGTGLGLSISKQLVELMNGNIGVTSEYGKGSEFYFTIHQKIIDEKPAAQLSEGRSVVTVGNMENEAANEMLKKLSDKYGLTYIEDIMIEDIMIEDILSAELPTMPVYYFTDKYERLDDKEKQRLSDLNAVVCVMQNPMAPGDIPEGMLTMNKPLYSYNLCNLIENRQNTDGSEQEVNGSLGSDPSKEGERDAEPDITDFVAPSANVLIVDDNEINCMVAQELISPLRMQVELASDGSQALGMIKQKRYDLVFMDHLMPVMDGIEAVKALRQLDGEYYKNLPVIALTGNTAKEQQEEYMQAGMNDYLSKPLDMEDICRKIRKWIPDKVMEK